MANINWAALRKKIKDMTLGAKVTILLSIFSLILSIYVVIRDNDQNNRQDMLVSAVATFDARAQATSIHQAQQQLDIQNTQVAMQSKMDDWLVKQGIAQVDLITPPDPIFVVNKVTSEQTSGGYLISGVGNLEILLVNSGGGKAGLLNIDWIKEGTPQATLDADLSILHRQINDQLDPPPFVIEGQTPVKVLLTLQTKIPYADDPEGKSDYALGEYLKTALTSIPSHFDLRFTDITVPKTLLVKISSIQLAMPVVEFKPDPPSPFSVTNQTPLTVQCFDTDGKEVVLRATNTESHETTETNIKDNDCLSFPKGEYELSWREVGSNTTLGTQSFSLASDNPTPIGLGVISIGWIQMLYSFLADRSFAIVGIVALLAIARISLSWLREEIGTLYIRKLSEENSSRSTVKAILLRFFIFGSSFQYKTRIDHIPLTIWLHQGKDNAYYLNLKFMREEKTYSISVHQLDNNHPMLLNTHFGNFEVELRLKPNVRLKRS